MGKGDVEKCRFTQKCFELKWVKIEYKNKKAVRKTYPLYSMSYHLYLFLLPNFLAYLPSATLTKHPPLLLSLPLSAEVPEVPPPGSHPASLAIIHQKARAFKLQFKA